MFDEEDTPILVKRHPNLDMRSYHLKFEVSKAHIESFWGPIRPESKEYLKKLGRKGQTLVRRLLVIPGVAEVTIQPYELGIKKGSAFEWEDIEPVILETIENFRPKAK